MKLRSAHSRVVTVCLMLGSTQAFAASESPVFPKSITVTWSATQESEPNVFTLLCNGTGLCEWGLFRIDLYEAALYLENVSRSARGVIESDQVKQVRLHFVRGLTKKQMQRAYNASFRANAKDELNRYQPRIDRFVRMIPAVKKGDCLTFTYFPGRGLEVRRGKTVLVSIPGNDFGRLFLSLYVGSIPPTQDLKKGLLGLSRDV